jgi:uncharacterized membrane protein YjjP (DUF1212 family)
MNNFVADAINKYNYLELITGSPLIAAAFHILFYGGFWQIFRIMSIACCVAAMLPFISTTMV